MSDHTYLRDSLHSFIKRKDYKNCYFVLKKIYALIESEKRKYESEMNPNQRKMRDCTLETNIDILKITLRNDIMFLLINRRHISLDIIKLVKSLDKNYENTIKEIICTEIVRSTLLKFRRENGHVGSINSITDCYRCYEDIIDDLKLNYSHFPFLWNLLGEFTFGFCREMKEILLNILYLKEWKRNDIIRMLNETIAFETKNTQYCFIDCCMSDKKIIFRNADIIYNSAGDIVHTNIICNNNTENLSTNNYSVPLDFKTQKGRFCEHKKILSMTFAPFFKHYVENLFDKVDSIEFNRENQETNIFSCMIDFYRQLSEILIKIQYFNDETLFDTLVWASNNHLANFLDKVIRSKTFSESCVTLNSLMYAEDAYIDFISYITTKTNKTYTNLTCIRKIRKIENIEYKNINEHIDSFLRKLFKNKVIQTFNQQLFQFFENNFLHLEYHEFNENVVHYIVEAILQSLFSVLIKIKMDTDLSEFFLIEIIELKKCLSTKLFEIPFIDTIERYLKIFLVSPIQTVQFIENFELFSRGTFNFSQILKILKNEDNNITLFIEYKKHVNE